MNIYQYNCSVKVNNKNIIKMISQILKRLKPGKGEMTVDGAKVTYSVTPNGYHVTIEKQSQNEDKVETKVEDSNAEIVEYVNKFMQSIQSVDDDIFTEACEQFNHKYKYATNELQKLLNEAKDFDQIRKGANLFRAAINRAVAERLSHYRKQLQWIDTKEDDIKTASK